MENMTKPPVNEVSGSAKNAQSAVHKRYKTIRVTHNDEAHKAPKVEDNEPGHYVYVPAHHRAVIQDA